MNRPNIIYLHSHDTGRCISPYGYHFQTPHFERLAARSTLFRNAFCAAPTCSPSRAALLTGQWAHQTGMLGLHHRGFNLTHPERHLAAVLRGAGYDTTLIGVNHVAADVRSIGYERVLPTDPINADVVASQAETFLRSAPTEPFFLDIGFVETHRGRFPEPAADIDPARLLPPAGLPDLPVVREDLSRFATAVRQYDASVGRILDALDQNGLSQRTLIVCTTDHGISFPRRKCNVLDGGLEVLLMIAEPNGVNGGASCSAMVSQVDIVPTICEYIGLDAPRWLVGHSLLPAMREPGHEIREELFGEVTYHAAYDPQRAIRTRRYKFIRRFGDRRLPVPSNMDDGLTKSLFLDSGYGRQPHPSAALFDLVLDPHEQRNLIDEPTMAAVTRDLSARLDRWMRDTNDPLLAGDVPLPPGAFANHPDDYSPQDALARRASGVPHG